MRYFFLIFIVTLNISLKAQIRKYSNEFLNIGVGARGLAMGNAQVATVNDATAALWNPARLAYINDMPQVSVMHANYFSGIAQFDYGTVALPTKSKKRTIAVSFVRFAIDNIPNTLGLIEKDGTINYSNVTNFSAADYAGYLSFGQKLGKSKNWNIGANAKVVRRIVGKFANSWGFGVDLGVSYQKDNTYFSIMGKDLSTTFNAWSFNFTDREKEVLLLTNNEVAEKSYEITAPQIIIGAAKKIKLGKKSFITPEINLITTFDGKRNTVLSSSIASIDPRIGVELNVSDAFFLRGGIGNFQQTIKTTATSSLQKEWIFQPSGGAGFKNKNISLDYAFTSLENQENPLYTHVFSLNFKLEKKAPKKKTTQSKIKKTNS